MLVIDIDFNTFREIAMAQRGVAPFYTETARTVTLYREFNGMLFRHVRKKLKDDQQELVWRSINMRWAFKVDRVSNFGEDEWKEYFTHLYDVLSQKSRKK